MKHAFKVLAFSLALALQSPAAADIGYSYGQHLPNGQAAVDHIYGSQGTWKSLTNVEYIWNYYQACATSNHPFDRTALINYANGIRQTTTRDANCRLLLDFNNNGELDVTSGGAAFHEHNAIGVNGSVRGAPFTNFWFDDNWFARYMSIAYGRTQPNGLWETSGFNRWKIVGGQTAGWQPYNPPDQRRFGQLSLDGLYYLSAGDSVAAIARWDRWLAESGAFYDGGNQRDAYPNVIENYHLGLQRMLTEKLLQHASLSAGKRAELEQHSVHLRSHILSNQQRTNGTLLGWLSGIGDNNTLINTESVTANALGLGAGGRWAFEAGRAPLQFNPNNYFLRSHNVLSAVTGLSQPGYLVYGPYRNFPTGSLTVDYYLRAPSPQNSVAVVDIRNSATGQTLASRTVAAADMRTGNQWTKISLSASIPGGNSLEFRVYWTGSSNLDVAFVQVR